MVPPRGAGRSGAGGERAAGDDGLHRHGRDHAAHRELRLAVRHAVPQALRGWPAAGAAERRRRGSRWHARAGPRGDGATRLLLSGMALANSGLGLAHGVAAALGAAAHVTHGLACALMLPVALRSQPAGRRTAQLAQLARTAFGATETSDGGPAAQCLHREVSSLCAAVRLPPKAARGRRPARQLDDLVKLSRGNSMNGNPRQLDDAELRAVLEACCDSRRRPHARLAADPRLRPPPSAKSNGEAEVHLVRSGKVINVGMALTHLGADARTLPRLAAGRAGRSPRSSPSASMPPIGLKLRRRHASAPRFSTPPPA